MNATSGTRAAPLWLKILMALLAVPNVITGLWAVISPAHWFDNFPGWAPQLVAAFPPYNQHLATDAGAGLLASGLVMLVAVIWPKREVLITAAVGYLAFSTPHFLFHAFNSSPGLDSAENTVNNASLIAAVIGAAVVLLWPTVGPGSVRSA